MKSNILILLAHGLIGWMLCGATIGIGMAVTTMENALIIHAIAAPCFFVIISLIYFSRNHFLSSFHTAIVFLAIVVGMDFFVVALLINHSLEMFTSLIGTWLPFTLIFLSTWVTGEFVINKTTSKKLS
jgi:hypothetical protein